MNEMENFSLGTSHYGFSGAKLDTLGATEYTLISLHVDESGSVDGFARDMEKCIGEVLAACQKSPRKDNLLMRVATFGNGRLMETHGFKLLDSIKVGDYDGSIHPDGMTPLNDSVLNGVGALGDYGATLYDHDYTANGILIVITDGCENSSGSSVADIVREMRAVGTAEKLESLVTILIGVNVTDGGVHAALEKYAADCGFTSYVELKDATASTLAKVAKFVSKSISSQSNSLGSGKASIPLTF